MVRRPIFANVVLDLEVGQTTPVGQNLAQQRAEPRDVQHAVAQLVERAVDGLLRREPEGLVEGAIRRQDAQVGVEHQQRFPDRALPHHWL